MLVGRYVTHALIVNTFRLLPPVPSIWDDGFGLPTPDSGTAAHGAAPPATAAPGTNTPGAKPHRQER